MWRAAFVFLLFALPLLGFLELSHRITERKLLLPMKEQEVVALQEEIALLLLKEQRMRHPRELFDFAKDPRYAHLHFPSEKEVITISSNEK